MKELKIIEDADYFDENTKVYDLENGDYFVWDTKENIKFECTRETLEDYSFTNHYSFSTKCIIKK